MIASLFLVERDGVARTAFPITGGIALPSGAAADAASLYLRDAHGQPADQRVRRVIIDGTSASFRPERSGDSDRVWVETTGGCSSRIEIELFSR